MKAAPSFASVVLILCGALPATAEENWAYKMFETTSHDFGVVARGADVRTLIEVQNVYKEDVHISNVSTSCGCTVARKPAKTLLASGEKTYVEISMDTKKFVRRKDSAVIVEFDKPLFAEVRIPVTAYIRTDVVFTPGAANFGAVAAGEKHTRKIGVAYAGRADWKIKDVKTHTPHLDVKVTETGRDAARGTVDYDLEVALEPTAPAGTYRHQIHLVTDDESNPLVPLLVEATIESEFTVTPPALALGTLTPGQVVRKNVVVRGRDDFRIAGIEAASESDAFNVRVTPSMRKVHVVPIAFTAPGEPGDFSETLSITVEGRSEPISFRAYGKIAAGE